MMYENKLIAAIKVNGQVLRENGDLVSLPFGSEYSILVKNLNSVRMMISVSVDGTAATDGRRLIIAPNSSVELERFIRNGNLTAGNRFKFIERTDVIEQHRGVGVEDGLIRVEGWKEAAPILNYDPLQYYWQPCQWSNSFAPQRKSGTPNIDITRGASAMHVSSSAANYSSVNCSVTMDSAGITVPGTESNQQFYQALGFPLEPTSTIIVIRLCGQVNGQLVSAPVTVAHKPSCSTCGRTNKANSKFCSQCGTALQII